jgi:hypothetical protein
VVTEKESVPVHVPSYRYFEGAVVVVVGGGAVVVVVVGVALLATPDCRILIEMLLPTLLPDDELKRITMRTVRALPWLASIAPRTFVVPTGQSL